MKEEARKKEETKIRKKVKENKDNEDKKAVRWRQRQLPTYLLSVFSIKQYKTLRTDVDVDMHIYLYTHISWYIICIYISW